MSIRRAGVLGFAVLLAVAGLAACGGPSAPNIRVEDAWALPALAMPVSGQPSTGEMGQTADTGGLGMAGTGAVFLRLVNKGGEADRLVSGQTEVANAVEIHETVVQGDVIGMQRLPEGLEVPARSQVLLEPGSYHVMLIGLQQDLRVGERFSLDLQFEKSGTITVEPEVREP